MNRFRLFFGLLVAVYAVFGLLIAWYGTQVPQYAGDLTRLGGYSEADYAWRKPQHRYVPALYEQTDDYPPDVDVLVLGDSMSFHRVGEQTDPGVYWPNHLAQASGWRIAALHRGSWLIEDLIHDPRFLAAPPRVFVLELAERAIMALDRITAGADASTCTANEVRRTPLVTRSLAARPEKWAPPELRASGADFSLGANHLKRKLLNSVYPGWNETLRFELSRGGLFSNLADRSLLIYADDMLKLGVTPQLVEQQRCALIAIQNQMHAVGVGHFVVLVVPDKASVYRRYAIGFPENYPDLIDGLARNAGLNFPRVDLAFRDAIDAGTPDLFLPNDTHLGVAGHELIAEVLLHHLIASGVAASESEAADSNSARLATTAITASRP